MTRQRSFLAPWRRAGVLLVALALAMRLLLPAGFMPTQTARGITVSICNGMGTGRTVVLDVGAPAHGKGKSQHEEPAGVCAFAAMAAPALAPDSPAALTVPALLLAEIALPPPAAIQVLAAKFLTPPLRGPPASA